MDVLRRFVEVFVPLFVAMSPLTVLTIFLGMTEGVPTQASRQLARSAVIAAFCVAIGIVLLGQATFRFLGITLDDLRVAGGVILLTISVYDLIFTRERRKATEMTPDAGVVPLGIPLMVGPATMTACVVLADSHGRLPVIVALLVNLGTVWVLLHFSDRLQRVIRPAVTRAFGKVMSLFLAAIAVAMLRSGILAFVRGA